MLSMDGEFGRLNISFAQLYFWKRVFVEGGVQDCASVSVVYIVANLLRTAMLHTFVAFVNLTYALG